MRAIRTLLAAGLLLGTMLPRPSAAETGTITLARQFGIAFIPFLMMEDGKLIEKHAQALGLAELKVSRTVLTGAAVMNDALLSAHLSFGTGAAPASILLWDRTWASANPIRGIAAIARMPTYLNTCNPAIHTLRDYTDKNRIALPSVELPNAALVLQMAAAKVWGDDQYARLDPLTVSMGHPDAVAQVMGSGEITSHFASPPDQVLERRDPHTIYSPIPLTTMAFAEFMHNTDSIRIKPARWTDMFFPVAHDLLGN